MHVATVLWQYKRSKVEAPKEKGERITFLGTLYTQATHAIEENPDLKKEVSAIYRDLEDGKGKYLALWKKTAKWSIDYIKAVFKELNLPVEAWYFESDLISSTKQIIEKLKTAGLAKESQGAIVVDLEKEKLGFNLLIKTDGTLLYNAKDIALALKKEEDWHPQQSLYLVDARQSLAMQQLFATLKLMGWQKDLCHLSYEFVTLKNGAMSSRKGNIVRFETFRDEMINFAREETKKRHTDWPEKKIEKTARGLAFAAMRFGMLKQDADKLIVFDMQEAMSFDGFSGPYLLYTCARLKSILRKGRRVKIRRTGEEIQHPLEHQLLVTLARYPETVFNAAANFAPVLLAQYLFTLAQNFSAYYSAVPVLQADKKLVGSRLAMVAAVHDVLENGLTLLGIESLKEM